MHGNKYILKKYEKIGGESLKKFSKTLGLLIIILIMLIPLKIYAVDVTNEYGEPNDVLNASSWEDLDPSRYGESKAEAKASKATSAEDNYQIALENELMKMNNLLNNVSDKELESYDSEKLNKYLQALENFSKNEKVSDTNGTLINDTFYVDTKNNIDRIKEKFGDKLSDDQKDQLDRTEENSGNNSQDDYEQWAEDQGVSNLNGEFDIDDGGTSLGDVVGGILMKPLTAFCQSVLDAVNATLQNIMASNEDSTGFLSKAVSILGDAFDIMNKDSADTEFDSGDPTNVVTVRLSGNGFKYPHIHYSCEEIFAGKIGLLNIDFISGDGQAKSLSTVRNVISSWYKALRLIATIGFLSVLIYTGIRIMVSSTAQDKAKYKEWIINWIVGFAILYFLHYLMSFIIVIISKFNEMLANSMQYVHVRLNNSTEFNTNLIGLVRFCTQSDVIIFRVGYLILYTMLTVYTVKFTIVYLKRLINMAFLTLIAPIVAFTYPIDKLADGQAQGFDAWIKEYIFNALLQPMHFILYYALVGSAVKLAATNPIYAIAVLAFMTEGERLLKKIFGFDKANGFGTVKGMQDAIIGGAIASKVTGMLGKGKGNAE